MSGGWLAGDVGALPAPRRGGGAGMAVVDQRWSGSPVRPAPSAVFDRRPPQDLAAEQSVLGGMLLSKDAARGPEVTLPPPALGDARHLAIDGARVCGGGHPLLGRIDRPPPNNHSIV
jgi:hypothetical protein